MNNNTIENQIKVIPGNAAVLNKLYELLNTEQAVAFVGAGASAELWPLWNELLESFIDYSLSFDKIKQSEVDFFKHEILKNPLEIAQQLRNKTGDRHYFEYLHAIFKDKISLRTGEAFTLTHKTLLQLPIHNYITLNYDAGLTNARASLYPKATTSYFFWDQDEARRILEPGNKRLILHAHGRYDRADSIILTLDDYHKAYNNSAFVRILNELFNSKKIIFVGFGMNDPYIKQLFHNISKDNKTAPFKHIAFIGLDMTEIPTANLHREYVEMVFGARVLFYPTANNHQALTDWLTMLDEKYSGTASSYIAEDTMPIPTPPNIKALIKDKYVHKTTDDENYQGRMQDFITLNRYANDPETRTIAITGIGGQGKTAMTGRWLKHERHEALKNIPVFYWSFYEGYDVAKFLEEVVEFCMPIVHIRSQVEIEPITFILSVVSQERLVIVLDGLEVLQEDVSSSNHGEISHPLLNPFLQNWLRVPHKGLMILTSRFHFPQLDRFSGVGFHYLDLIRLNIDDGVSLLKKLTIFGDEKILENYVEKLSGHPLALRVLASTVKRCCFGDISKLTSNEILLEGDVNKISKKFEHLLSFYEQQLKDGQKELLGIISLFKRPIETESFVTLLNKMKSLENTPLANADKATIECQLSLLIDDFLIEKTDKGITTHPVIRDYFRTWHKIDDSWNDVSDFLKNRPGTAKPKNINDIHDLVDAVQLLCDEGEFISAEDLFKNRLAKADYGFDIFTNFPALTEGLACDLAFVGDEFRMQKVRNILGQWSVAFHCSGVALYNWYLGNLKQALEWRILELGIIRQLYSKDNEAMVLQETSLIEMNMGNILKARETVSQAINLSFEADKNLLDLRTEFFYKAYYEFLLGESRTAYKYFEIALHYGQYGKYNIKSLTGIGGVQQAEFFIRIQAWPYFEEVNNWNINRCEENQWNIYLAVCYLLKAWYEICKGPLSNAENTLVNAERIVRPSGIVDSICRLDWTWALLFEAKKDYDKGLQCANSALLICANKGLRLRQADLLILRGRLHLLKFQNEAQQDCDLLEKVGEDGHDVLRMAEQTRYIWAKIEALELLISYHHTKIALSDSDLQDKKDCIKRYTNEIVSLKSVLYLSNKQIKGIKSQALKEFNQYMSKSGQRIVR